MLPPVSEDFARNAELNNHNDYIVYRIVYIIPEMVCVCSAQGVALLRRCGPVGVGVSLWVWALRFSS